MDRESGVNGRTLARDGPGAGPRGTGDRGADEAARRRPARARRALVPARRWPPSTW